MNFKAFQINVVSHHRQICVAGIQLQVDLLVHFSLAGCMVVLATPGLSRHFSKQFEGLIGKCLRFLSKKAELFRSNTVEAQTRSD
jgi:hypothetical protein